MPSVHDEDRDHVEEVLDGELVERPPAPPVRREPAREARPDRPAPNSGPVWTRTPAAQNAIVAATGFVAGAATMALVRHYGGRRLERALTPPPAAEPVLSPGAPLGTGRTYIVHVRQIGADLPHEGRTGSSRPPLPPPALGPGTSGE